MRDRDRTRARGSGRWLRRSTTALVVLVLLAAGLSYQLDLGALWFGNRAPSPLTAPDKVLPPEGLALPAARPAPAVAEAQPGRNVSGVAVRRALAPLIGSAKLGRHVVVDVAQLSDGTVVYRHGTGLMTPASTMKLLTTTAALEALGPARRFETVAAVGAGGKRVVLVGGGDPLLARRPSAPGASYPQRADLTTLARQTARALRAQHRSRTRLVFDDSLFRGPAVNPLWEPMYLPDEVRPITALWVDEGRAANGATYVVKDPAAAAADFFAAQLRERGIRVAGEPVRGRLGHEPVVARVRSAPLSQIVQHTLEASDNNAAEVLARQVAVATNRPPTFSGGAAAVRRVLSGLGVDTSGDRIYDGSGLSRHDRLSPRTLLSVLEVAAASDHPHLRTVVTSLPVAGFTGSLAYRFDDADPRGRGTVRAKTGTLSGVHVLAGVATSRDDALMVFVAAADRVKAVHNLDAQALVDRMAGALGGCRCAATP